MRRMVLMKRLLFGAALVVAMAVPVVAAAGSAAVGGVATDGTGAEYHVAIGFAVHGPLPSGAVVLVGHARITSPTTGDVLDGPVFDAACLSPATTAVVIVCNDIFAACGPFFANATALFLDETSQTVKLFQFSSNGTSTVAPQLVLTMTHGQIITKCP